MEIYIPSRQKLQKTCTVSVADAQSWSQQPEELRLRSGVASTAARKSKAAADMCPRPQFGQSCIVNDGERGLEEGLPDHLPGSNPAAHRIAQVLALRLNSRADPSSERATTSSHPAFESQTRTTTTHKDKSDNLGDGTRMPGQRTGPPSGYSTLSNPDAKADLTHPKEASGLWELSAVPVAELPMTSNHLPARCASTPCPPQRAAVDSLGDLTCRISCVGPADAFPLANKGATPCEGPPAFLDQGGSLSGASVIPTEAATNSLVAQQLEADGHCPVEQAYPAELASAAEEPQPHGSDHALEEAPCGGEKYVLASPCPDPLGPFPEGGVLPQQETPGTCLIPPDPTRQRLCLQEQELSVCSREASSLSSSSSLSPRACPESEGGGPSLGGALPCWGECGGALQPSVQPRVQKEPADGEAETREASMWFSMGKDAPSGRGMTESAAVEGEAAGASSHVGGEMWERVARLEREVGELRGERSLLQGYVTAIAEEVRAWMGRVDACFLSLEARLEGEERRQAALEALQTRTAHLEKSQPSLEVRSPIGVSTLPNRFVLYYRL